jgi:hypothetical protein
MYRTRGMLIFDNLANLDAFDPRLFAKSLDQVSAGLLRRPLKDSHNVVVYDAHNS